MLLIGFLFLNFFRSVWCPLGALRRYFGHSCYPQARSIQEELLWRLLLLLSPSVIWGKNYFTLGFGICMVIWGIWLAYMCWIWWILLMADLGEYYWWLIYVYALLPCKMQGIFIYNLRHLKAWECAYIHLHGYDEWKIVGKDEVVIALTGIWLCIDLLKLLQ